MKSQRLKKLLRWTARVILALLVLFGLFIFEENLRGRITLARYKAELRAKGEKLTLAELNLPKPTSATNGAASLTAIADQLYKDTVGTREIGYLPDGWIFVKSDVAVVMHKQAAPIRKVYPSGLLKLSGSWHSSNDTVIDEELKRAQQVLQQGPIEFVLDYSAAMSLPLRHLVSVSHLSKWFSASALLKLHDADVSGALECLESMRMLADSIADERVMASQYHRLRIETSIFAIAWEVLQADDLTNKELDRLNEICDRPDVTSDMIKAFERETITYRQFYEDARHVNCLKRLGESLAPRHLVQSGWAEIPRLFREIMWIKVWLGQDEQRALQLQYSTLREAREAIDTGCWDKARDHLPKDSFHRSSPLWYDRWRFVLSELEVNAAWDRAVLNCFHVQTEREFTLTAIALKRHKLRYGQFPEDLSGLVPEFLHQQPRDYLDRGNLRYRQNVNSTFTLYSVGDECNDNGGDSTPLGHPFGYYRFSYAMWYGHDAVWPWPATAEEVEAWNSR